MLITEMFSSSFKSNLLQNMNSLTCHSILSLVNKTVSEKEIKKWHKGFRKDCPNGQLTEPGFLRIYKQFFPHGDPTKFARACFRVFDQNHVSNKSLFVTTSLVVVLFFHHHLKKLYKKFQPIQLGKPEDSLIQYIENNST